MPKSLDSRRKSSATDVVTRVLSTSSVEPGAVRTPALSDVEFASAALAKLITNAKLGAVAAYESMSLDLLDGLGEVK